MLYLEGQLKSIGSDYLDYCIEDSEAPFYLIPMKDVFHGREMGSRHAFCEQTLAETISEDGTGAMRTSAIIYILLYIDYGITLFNTLLFEEIFQCLLFLFLFIFC